MTRKDIPEIQLDRRSVLQAVGVTAGSAVVAGRAAGASSATGPTDDSGAAERSSTKNEEYELPDLPYAYDALEPAIDGRIVELHHGVHHEGYVDGANEALEELEEMRETGDFDGVKRAKRDLSFNLSGHVNHSIFWENMSSEGGGEPEGDLAAAIEEDFGSIDAFEDEFAAAANDVEGNGWATLVYDPVADRLLVAQVEGQNGLALVDSTPLLMLDVWEHAYYLQYENERDEYVDAWWDVVDWNDVADRLTAAESHWNS